MLATAPATQEPTPIIGAPPTEHPSNAEAVIAHFTPLYGTTIPNVNVLTFRRWLDAGRVVRKGEQGFGIFIYTGSAGPGRGEPDPGEPEPSPRGAPRGGRRGRWIKVFHIAQTDGAETPPADPADPTPAPVPATPRPAPAPAPTPAPRTAPGLTDKQRQEVQAAILKGQRIGGRLEYNTSTPKRWRDALGTMRDARRLAARVPALAAALEASITTLQAFEHVTIGTTGLDYFPTTTSVADILWQRAIDALPGTPDPALLDVLEPSAGDGALVAPALAAGANVCAVERSPTLHECLRAQFSSCDRFSLHGGDFMEWDGPGYTFDVIIANPPFEKGASAEHLRRMYTQHLSPGGVCVCIVGDGAFSGADARRVPWFPEWLEEVGADVEPAPRGSFCGTTAAARIVTITK